MIYGVVEAVQFIIIYLINMFEFTYPSNFTHNSIDKNRILESHKEVQNQKYNRPELLRILSEYNLSIGNQSALIAFQDSLLKEDCTFIVTGQQLGMMGGPSYTILKAITTILAAKEMNAIPLFWLATEDHDIGEIDHTYLIDEKSNLQKFRLKFKQQGSFVEDLLLTQEHLEVLSSFFNYTGRSFTSLPLPGASYCQFMAKELAYLFRETPLMFIEPHRLRPLAKEFLEKEIINSHEIFQILKDEELSLQKQGEQTPLEITSTNLFYKSDNGLRQKIKALDDELFTISHRKFTKVELLDLAKSTSNRFSTSAISRPLFQSMIIPTVAYVAGPTEKLYLRQLQKYHAYFDVAQPFTIPRISATITTPDAEEILKHLNLNPWDPIPESARKADSSIAKERYHYLNNLLFPRRQKQERVLNWWEFQRNCSDNLVKAFVENADWKNQTQLYCRMHA